MLSPDFLGWVFTLSEENATGKEDFFKAGEEAILWVNLVTVDAPRLPRSGRRIQDFCPFFFGWSLSFSCYLRIIFLSR